MAHSREFALQDFRYHYRAVQDAISCVRQSRLSLRNNIETVVYQSRTFESSLMLSLLLKLELGSYALVDEVH